MGRKVRDYERELWNLMWDYSSAGEFGSLREYLLSRSGLPGPRGNLELAAAFGNVIERGVLTGALDAKVLMSLCQSLCAIPPSLAPTNDPREYLVFCGVCGLGAVGTKEEEFRAAMASLKPMAEDSRWRTREGVAMAIQRLIGVRPKPTLSFLSDWADQGGPLLLRAVVAGVAEPRLLKDREAAGSALLLHEKVFARLPSLDRTDEGFKVLKKGLSYSLSVVVAASPREGFKLMTSLAGIHDPDVAAILRENLGKKRLLRFPSEVALVKRTLSG